MTRELSVRCCIAGGGPAGMMLALLLARAGIDVVVLEKHADFFRDFRGDTIHPSTLEIMGELGLLDEFLKRPHQEVTRLAGVLGGQVMPIADFSHVPTRCKFLAFMPQWDFLDFLSEHARRYPTFALHMETEAADLLVEGERVVGVRAAPTSGALEIHADLTVAADGRHSLLRARSGLTAEEYGAPMDVLWMRLSRRDGDPHQVFGYIGDGMIFIMLDRGDYWQCGMVIPKGSFADVQRRGLDEFHRRIAECAPFVASRLGELDDWEKIKLLTVQVDRLRSWYREGFLCIGDAAHAMSPVGGVGINLALQDAVAAANILWRPLRRRELKLSDLQRMQRRRTFPTRATQALQLAVQRIGVRRVLSGERIRSVPLAFRLLRAIPMLQRIPARVIGVGFRPEHVRSPDSAASGRTPGT